MDNEIGGDQDLWEYTLIYSLNVFLGPEKKDIIVG